jgi:hypothetical protein
VKEKPIRGAVVVRRSAHKATFPVRPALFDVDLVRVNRRTGYPVASIIKKRKDDARERFQYIGSGRNLPLGIEMGEKTRDLKELPLVKANFGLRCG